jgi:hypothetical protein
MKKLFTCIITLFTTVILQAQIPASNPQVKPGVLQQGSLTKKTTLLKFTQLRSIALPPLNKTNAQRLPVSGNAGAQPGVSANTISRTLRRTSINRNNETNTQEAGRFCTTAQVSEEKGEFEKIVLGNQNDKIIPGAIYYDNAIIDGSYNAPVNLQLKPYDITTNNFSAASGGSSSITVQPDMGSVYNGIAELMRRSSGVVTPAMVATEAREVYSSEQLAFFLQAGFQGYNVDLTAEFDYNKRTKKNLIFAKLKQVYFSITLNRPMGKDLISNDINSVPANLVYVNKVNYGRIGILKIETDSSLESIRAALDFTYSSNVTVNVQARMRYEKILANSVITGFFFGGDATNIVAVNSSASLREFNDYVRNGLRLNPNVAPTAISYELKYLNDNASAATNSTTSYTERKCETAKELKLVFNGVSVDEVHGGDCSYAWGTIDVEVWEMENGVRKRRVNPIINGQNSSTTRIWNFPDARSPQRNIINYAGIRSNNAPALEQIGALNWRFSFDPAKVASNDILFVFKCNINTNHKDNDLAALGFHGMQRVEERAFKLNEILVNSQELSTKAKYGSIQIGPFLSHAGSDRPHNFRAHFTLTAGN